MHAGAAEALPAEKQLAETQRVLGEIGRRLGRYRSGGRLVRI